MNEVVSNFWDYSIITEEWQNSRTMTHVGIVLDVLPDGTFITEEWYD